MTERQRLFVARPVPVTMHGKCQRIEFIGVDFSTLRPRGTLEAPAASPWAQFHSYTFGIRYAALSFSTGALGHDNDDPALRYGPNRLFFSLLREFFPPLKSLASPRVRAVLIDVTFPSKQQKRGLCFSGRVFLLFQAPPWVFAHSMRANGADLRQRQGAHQCHAHDQGRERLQRLCAHCCARLPNRNE